MLEQFLKLRHVKTGELVTLITDVCKALDKYSPEAVSLLLGTAAAESSLIHRVQIGGGPARGLWQMEPDTGYSLFDDYLTYRTTLWRKLGAVWFDISPEWVDDFDMIDIPTCADVELHLQNDDAFACAMARIKYLPVLAPIPKTVEGQAAYWKQHYNTPAGAQDVEHYLCQWEACHCEKLLKGE